MLLVYNFLYKNQQQKKIHSMCLTLAFSQTRTPMNERTEQQLHLTLFQLLKKRRLYKSGWDNLRNSRILVYLILFIIIISQPLLFQNRAFVSYLFHFSTFLFQYLSLSFSVFFFFVEFAMKYIFTYISILELTTSILLDPTIVSPYSIPDQ